MAHDRAVRPMFPWPPSRLDRPRIVRVISAKRETDLVTTIRWNDCLPASPGQYVMVWVPGFDEIPMSLSYTGKLKGISVHEKGEATRALVRRGAGTRVGIRGPRGTCFKPLPGRALVVAGGTGIAALSPLVELLARKGPRPVVVIGARTAPELLFVRRMKRTGAEVVVMTDDGSAGRRGLATRAAQELLRDGDFGGVHACGPELMMRALLSLPACRRLPVQVSLERYFKCGMGICDACAVGGRHLCLEGPVLDGRTVLSIPEFGKFRRTASGERENI